MKHRISRRVTETVKLCTISGFLAFAAWGKAAVLSVSNLNDGGAGSLRQAIADASSSDSITFAATVVGTITLTTNELSFSKSLNIIGPGAQTLAVSGNSTFRVFDILGGSSSISGLTIRDGRAVGSPATTEQTGADGQGGGIFNQGVALTLTGCVFSNNAAIGGQGGPTDVNTGGTGGAGMGGAICTLGPLAMTGCLVISNSATGGQGGAAGLGHGGTGGNSMGGGICSMNTTLALSACTLTGDSSTGGAGGFATGSIDAKGGWAYGGGLYTGGITSGTGNLTNCTISFSRAVAGAGDGPTYNGIAWGGAIENAQNLNLFTCTLANNQATDYGGALNDDGTTTLRSCTIASNTATYGGGIFGNSVSPQNMGNTILAGNSASSSSGPDCDCQINSSDYNLFQNTSGLTISSGGNLHSLNVDPMLGPLQDNGGPTPTMALLPGSPAIDQGKSFGITTDQRGRSRPYDFASIGNPAGGDGTDMGAYEAYPAPPSLSILYFPPNVLLSWPTNNTGYTLQNKTNLNPALTWSTAGSPAIVGTNFTVTNLATGGSMFYRLRGQ